MLTVDHDDELFIGDTLLREFGDCLECGLCCQFFDILPLYDEEINEISSDISIGKKSFLKKYTKEINNEDELHSFSLKTPCLLQERNICTIHKKRPLICQTFPLCINITKKRGVLSGIYICPQATQFYEAMLDFYKNNQPDVYNALLHKEMNVKDISLGMEIEGNIDLFSYYIDSFFS